MKSELKRHLLPLLILFLLISLIWILQKTVWYQYIYLFFGFLWGSFFLDLDHLLYWFYLRPDLEESRLAALAWKKGDFASLLKLLESTHKGHTSLVFHHYFFQIVLILISFFVFTSTSNVFAKAFLLALNLHLLVDEITDLREDSAHLQNWLFARENKQIPLSYLKYFVGIILLFNLIFILLLVNAP